MISDEASDRKWNERPSAATAKLAENESMFRLLFERSADAMTIQDPLTGVFLDVNEASVQITGAPDKAALLGSDPVIISPERQPDGSLSADKVKSVIQIVMERGSHRFEWVINRFDGMQLPVEIVLTLIRSGEKPLLLSVSRDITERKRIEHELRENQQLLVSVADNISEAIYRTGPNHELIFANRAYLRLSGHNSVEEMRHVPREKLYANPADRARLLAALAQNGVFQNEEIEYLSRDGKRWWGLTNSLAIRDKAIGKVLYHVGSVADITERKQAADEIRKLNASLEQRITERTAELTASEARLRTIVDHAPEAIVVLDGDTAKFLSSNVHAQELYGCTTEELTRLTPVDVSPEFQADGRPSAVAAREWINAALAGQTPIFEWIHRHSSGRLIPTEVRLVRLPAEGKKLLRASIIDNTEHKRVEKQLRERGEQMQKHRDVLLKLARADKSDFDKALRTITSLAASTLAVARVSYWAMQEQDSAIACELLRLNSSQEFDEKFKGTRLGAADAPAYFSALALKRPIVASDVQSHPAMAGLIAGYLNPRGITSLLDVPVWVRGEVVGVICNEHIGPAREWSAEEVDFASSLAAMVSLALEESSRARSERMLRESEEKFKALFTLSPLGMARVSWDGRFLQANDSFARIIGRKPEEVLKLSYWDVTPREYEAQELTVLDTLQKTGRFGPFEKEYLHRDGHRVPIVINGMLVKSAVGTDEIWGIVEDNTQRKQAEEALRESEEKFRALFEASSQGIMLHDEFQYLEVNPAVVQMLGYDSASELIGLSPAITSPPIQANGESSTSLAPKYIHECLTKGHVRFEWVARRKNGEDIPVEVILTRIQWGGKQIIQAAVNDISQRKRAEAELLKSLAREKELGQLKSNFVSMVSHEFRTPLGIIQSSAEILNDYLEQLAESERKEQLASITSNTRRMAEMMEEILVLSRLDAGRMDFKPATIDLNTFCRRVVDEVQSATDRRCAIELSLADENNEAQADERLLGHIFTNVLINAVKYSEPGSTVRFAIEPDGTDAVCTIRDRGIGIPEADQQWLFNAFQRGANVGDRPGTGLGLVIVKRCMELHGGKIEIKSKSGEGTEVTLRLPLFPI
ncbi:MAG: PAS domain S-box protein [Limisphaerales bacterium]